MKPSTLIAVTFGCAVLGWLMGCAAALIWAHRLVSFGGFLGVALVSMWWHRPHQRVAGVPLNQPAAPTAA